MMANAKCLRIAAALSVSEAARSKAATGRSGWTGALCMDHAGPGNGPSRGCDAWSRDHDHPQAGHRERILRGLNRIHNGPRSPLAITSRHWTLSGPAQVTAAPPEARDLPRRCGTGQTRQHSRSLSYLSLTLWCVASRSGWLGSCASPPQGQRKGRVIETEVPARPARSAAKNGWQRTKKQLRRERRVQFRPSLLLESRTCPVFR